MSDAWRYAIWPDSMSRSQGFWSSENCTFQSRSPPPLTEGAGKWPLLNYSTISKFGWAGFLKFVLVYVSRDLELGGVPAVSPSRKKFFRFQWNLVCTYRSMSDARRYTVWPDSRSRWRHLWSSENCTFPTLFPPPFAMAAGKRPLILKHSTISKFDPAGFSIFVLLFVSRDLELGVVPAVSPSTQKFFWFQWNLVCR